MDQKTKLYVSLGVLAALVGVLMLQRQSNEAQRQAHSQAGLAATLPDLQLTEERVKSIDRFTISTPAEGDAGPAQEVTLVKSGEDWRLKEPLQAEANAGNVKSLLDNLQKLQLTEPISETTDEYERWGVDEAQALHAVFFKGDEKIFDVYFGENGSRGQMTRVAGHDGVYAMKGLSKWLYDRDIKGWRDKTMFKFDDKEVVKVSIDNAHGSFRFEKEGDSWKGTYAANGKAPGDIPRFKPTKVDDLLRAYKSLSAMDFGDGKQRGDVGLDEPTAKVSVELTGGKALHVLEVGDKAEGSNRWAVTNGSDQIYSISSWSADWATAEPSKFQEAETEG